MKAATIKAQAIDLLIAEKYEEAMVAFHKAYLLYEQADAWEAAIDCLLQEMGILIELKRRKQIKRIDAIELERVHANIQFVQEKLGAKHPLYIKAKSQLISYYHWSAKYELVEKEGKQLLKEALPILGHGHEDIRSIYIMLIQRGRFDMDKQKILAFYNETLALLLQHKEVYQKELTVLYEELGFYYLHTNSQKAIQYFNKALAVIIVMEGEIDFLILLYNILGIAYAESRDSEKALQHFQKALHTVLSTQKSTYMLPQLYSNVALCYRDKNLLNQAILHQEKAIEHAHRQYDDKWPGLTQLYTNYGMTLIRQKAFQEALAAFRKAEQFYESLKVVQENEYQLNFLYMGFEECYRDMGDIQQSLFYLEKITQSTIFKARKDVKRNMQVLMRMGDNYLQLGAFQKALAYFQQSLLMDEGEFKETDIYLNPNKNTVQQLYMVSRTLEGKGKSFHYWYQKEQYALEDLQMSLYCLQLAEQIYQKIFDSLSLEESKTGFSFWSAQHKINSTLIRNLVFAMPVIKKQPQAFKAATANIIKRNEDRNSSSTFPYISDYNNCKEQIFKYGEQFKGRVLLDTLQSNQALLESKLPPEILAQEASLKKEILSLKKKIKQTENYLEESSTDEQQEYVRQLAQLRNNYLEKQENYEQVCQQLEAIIPTIFAHRKKEETIVSVAVLQEALTPHQLILSYFVLEEKNSIIIFSVQKEQWEIQQVNLPQGIDNMVKKLLKSINQLRYTKYVKLARQLYQLLLTPVLDNLVETVINELIIIPYEHLNYIPFECLLTADADHQEVNYAKLPYLIQAYQINYHYSASLFYHQTQLQKEKQAQDESFIGFAPVYNQQAPAQGMAQASTHLEPQELEAIAANSRSVRIGGQDYEALIHSEKEIKEVEQLFTKKAKTAQSFLHENATVEEFKKSVQHKKYIHIAAHGFETKAESGLTGIVFSPQETDDHQEDAVLFLPDMYALNLNADLVVLSSCKSGIGKLKGGEGMMAMNRGFLAAGAQNVVYTLFKIYDQASSEFVKYFFEQIVMHQKSYKEALQMAKQYMIQKEGFTPKHWAGFVLIGQ